MIAVIKDNFRSILDVITLDVIGVTTIVWLNDSMTFAKSIVALLVGLATLYLTYRKVSSLKQETELQKLEIEKVRLEVCAMKLKIEKAKKENE